MTNQHKCSLYFEYITEVSLLTLKHLFIRVICTEKVSEVLRTMRYSVNLLRNGDFELL